MLVVVKGVVGIVMVGARGMGLGRGMVILRERGTEVVEEQLCRFAFVLVDYLLVSPSVVHKELSLYLFWRGIDRAPGQC